MADPFGDPTIFEEFEKPTKPSDKILLSRYNIDKNQSVENDETDSENETSSHVPHVSESSGEATETKTSTLAAEIETLKQEIDHLKSENIILLKQNRLLDSTRFVNNGEGPAFEIVYLNNYVSRQYRQDMEIAIQHIMEKDRRHAREQLSALPSKTMYVTLASSSDVDQVHRAAVECKVVGNCHYYSHFFVDQLGWPLVNMNTAASDGWAPPRYDQVFFSELPVDELEVEEKKRQGKRPRKECFNCGGDHNLSECKEPKDYRRIKQKREEFMMNRNSGSMQNTSRYHIEDDPRFAAFSAGKISTQLRSALGLRDNELPRHIYAMRRLGYPPGHLVAAQVQTESGITMFDQHGREVDANGESMEDGEVNENMQGPPKRQINIEKVFEYPGFNAPVPDGVVDDGTPPIQQHHQKSEWLKTCGTVSTPVSRKRPAVQQNGSASKRQRTNSTDMDLSEGEAPLADEQNRDKQASDTIKLEKQDTEILISETDPPSSPVENFAMDVSVSTPLTLTVSGNHSGSASISFEFGTPVSQEKLVLPHADKFRDGITDFIPHEEYPEEARGHYLRLQETLKRVRTIIDGDKAAEQTT